MDRLDGVLSVVSPGTKEGCISLYRPGYSAHLCQFIENPQDFAGRTLTLSILAKSESGGWAGALIYAKIAGSEEPSIIASISHDSIDYQVVACTAAIPDGVTEMFVDITSSNAKKSFIKAAKLEVGSQQTLAHQDASGKWILNDPPPDKTLEMMKCQRYYQRIHFGLFTGTIIPDDDKKIAYTPYRYPVRMRTTPAITMQGTVHVRTGVTDLGSNALANVDYATEESSIFWFEASETAGSGESASVYLAENSYIEFTADL